MRADDVKLLIRQEVVDQQGHHVLVGGIRQPREVLREPGIALAVLCRLNVPGGRKSPAVQSASSSVLRITVNSCGGGLAWVDTFSPQRHKNHTRQVWQSARPRAPEYHLADRGPGREA